MGRFRSKADLQVTSRKSYLAFFKICHKNSLFTSNLQICFTAETAHAKFSLPPIRGLKLVCPGLFDIDQGIHKGKMKVAVNLKRKKLHGFSFSINIANFEAFL